MRDSIFKKLKHWPHSWLSSLLLLTYHSVELRVESRSTQEPSLRPNSKESPEDTPWNWLRRVISEHPLIASDQTWEQMNKLWLGSRTLIAILKEKQISTLKDAALVNTSDKVVLLEELNLLDSVSTTLSENASTPKVSWIDAMEVNLELKEKHSVSKVLEMSDIGLLSSSRKTEVLLLLLLKEIQLSTTQKELMSKMPRPTWLKTEVSSVTKVVKSRSKTTLATLENQWISSYQQQLRNQSIREMQTYSNAKLSLKVPMAQLPSPPKKSCWKKELFAHQISLLTEVVLLALISNGLKILTTYPQVKWQRNLMRGHNNNS